MFDDILVLDDPEVCKMKGKLIVIEGTDCSGKNTQGELLVQNLKKEGMKTVYLSFPMYDTPTGKILGGPVQGREDISSCWFPEKIKLDPHVACLYYAADRKYNIDKVMNYINDGYYVILDRYISSNMAHQGSKILDQDERFNMFQWIDKLEYWLLGLPKPDKTIFLHVPYEKSIELSKKREFRDVAEKDPEHLKNAEKTYIELSQLYHWDTVQCVRDGKLRTIEDIAKEILEIVL